MTHFIAPRILVLEGLYADTADIVTDAGGIGIEASPWNWKQVEAKLKSNTIDGVLLTGGTDVNPARYGQEACAVTQTPDYMRDMVELEVIKYARAHKIPVLGICRGSQIMCVSQGGRLCQDIQLYTDAWGKHNGGDHGVRAAGTGTVFERACGSDYIKSAISLHHQCVQYPGNGMRIGGVAFDGTPESIESKDGLMLGVQFHPEMTAYSDPQAFAIFRWLVETAARRAGGKAFAVNFREVAEEYREKLAASWHHYKSDSSTGDYTSDDWPWDDDEDRTASTQGKSASNPTGVTTRPYVSRKAGEPSIPSLRETTPSQREMVRLIEESTGQRVIVTDSQGNAVVEATCTEIMPDEGLEYPTDTPRSGYMDDAATEALLSSLLICPTCHVRFDLIEDCDDHKKFVHPQDEKTWQQRFAEMNDPPTSFAEMRELTDKALDETIKGFGYNNDKRAF